MAHDVARSNAIILRRGRGFGMSNNIDGGKLSIIGAYLKMDHDPRVVRWKEDNREEKHGKTTRIF